ncbi:MAG TPA: hypothetical protein VJC18_01140 [bacterium]|nr:hypothetical protein [bacterium]
MVNFRGSWIVGRESWIVNRISGSMDPSISAIGLIPFAGRWDDNRYIHDPRSTIHDPRSTIHGILP